MMYDTITIGTNIRKLRKLFNFTQEDLCNKLGKGRNTLSSWENGKLSTMSLADLVTLCNIFHCDINVICQPLDLTFIEKRKKAIELRENDLTVAVNKFKEALNDIWN